MMERVELTEDLRYETMGHSSKGNQLKWCHNGKWYKADYMGYEGLAEVLISRLLEKSNIKNFVHYEMAEIFYKNCFYKGCYSENFLLENEYLITLERLFRQYTGMNLTQELAKRRDITAKIRYLVDNVCEITKLQDFGTYLTILLEMDAMFCNEDRHMNNIAVILNDCTGEFRLCPYFDNGLALFADTRTDFGLDKSVMECLERIEAKPFSRNFDEQMEAAEELYGVHLELKVTKKDIRELLETFEGIYDSVILERVEEFLRRQIRRYIGE